MKKVILSFCAAVFTILVLIGILFCFNGLNTSWKTPDYGETTVPAITFRVDTVKILTYNIAKCDVYEGGFAFLPVAEVESHLDRIAEMINKENPDLIFLNEINYECAPCPVNQVKYLAEKTNMHAFAFGANYSWGLPFYRIRSGVALLSRFPLEALETQQLAGGKPFYEPTNNRRILWTNVLINGQKIVAASLRNDSFEKENNFRQMQQILRKLGEKQAILAGDFNANPSQASIKLIKKSGHFSGEFDGDFTFPTKKPRECIDFIFAPNTWKLIEHHVIKSPESDHLPVFSIFVLPGQT